MNWNCFVVSVILWLLLSVNFSMHMKASHLYECLYHYTHCDKAYNTHNDQDTHVQAVHQEKSLKCKLCPYTAEKEYKMVKHATVHQGRKFECDRYDVALNSKEALREHTKHYLDDVWYQCMQCDKSFMSEVSLRQQKTRQTWGWVLVPEVLWML